MCPRASRGAVILGAAGIPLAVRGAASADNWLLVDRDQIEAAKAKAEKNAWAKAALDSVLRNARQALDAKVELPDRGGQCPHWDTCKRDGVKLDTDPPTRPPCPKGGTKK